MVPVVRLGMAPWPALRQDQAAAAVSLLLAVRVVAVAAQLDV
jgi:hypothetical protein